ncbi:pantoate--beta-alanine ligase [Cohnella panacarvi]|uniref:pantoate--beta-alanine ligase n=1 Tax=Cohnella panacarvi TaxID=400776 RepID=UPI00047EBA86|nr:pantoate--beta-alanine ligase [Cohnella panacarvi]
MMTHAKTPAIVRTIAELRQRIKAYRRAASAEATVGFVPTMGYLHGGHASLLRRSVHENGLTVLSIFVNPLQFGPNEDLARYPRDEERDVTLAASNGVDIVFLPSVEEMYPVYPLLTTVSVSSVSEHLCGASRPGHFDGVATVVAKLFNIVQPDRAYFGLKDAQQVAVIAQMAADLSIPVEIVPCPIVREQDGLALSSRNVYLSAGEREQSLALSRSLAKAERWVAAGATAQELAKKLAEDIRQAPSADIDYVEIVTYPGMQPIIGSGALREYADSVLIALAVRFGRTRLIDNLIVKPKEAGDLLCSAK